MFDIAKKTNNRERRYQRYCRTPQLQAGYAAIFRSLGELLNLVCGRGDFTTDVLGAPWTNRNKTELKQFKVGGILIEIARLILDCFSREPAPHSV